MIKLEVGSVLQAMQGKNEGVYFEADGAGYSLIYNFMSPTEKEIEATKAGQPFEIRFLAIRSALWILSKCGTLNWTDAPFTPHLSRHAAELVRPQNEDEGTMLTLIMTDARDATIKSIRVIGLGHRFSVRLYDAIRELAELPFTPENYNLELALTRMHPTNELVSMARNYYKQR